MPQVTIPETNNIYRQAGSLVLTIEDESTKTANLLKTGPFRLKKETNGFSIGTEFSNEQKKLTVATPTAGSKTLIWSWIRNNHRLIVLDNETNTLNQTTKENSQLNEEFGLIDLAVPTIQIDGKSEQEEIPTPENPVEIKSLSKDLDIINSSVGRNILLNSNNILMNGSDNGNIGLAKKVEDHVEITPTTDGNVYDIGVKTSIDRVKGETYTFSLEVNTQQDYGMYYRPGNWFNLDIVKNTHGSWKRVSYTYLHDGTTGSAKDSFLIGFHGMKAGNTLKYRNLKIEKGNLTEVSLAPEDIPYDIGVKNIYKTNIQLSEPLRSVGDVHDRVYLDEKDGKWKVERNIYKYTLLPSMKFYPYSSKENVYSFSHALPNNPKQDTNLANFAKSNRFIQIRRGSVSLSEEEGIFLGLEKLVYVSIRKSLIPSKEDISFTEWLKNNQVEIIYQLETPTIEILPQTEQVKLNGLANNLFGHPLYLLLDGEAIELESAYFTGAYTSLSIYSQDVLYDEASTTLLSKLKASGTRLFDADYTQPMHYAKKPFLEATMAPEDNSPILVQDEEGPMQRQYFFDHITGIYKEDNTESFVYRGEDVLMVSYEKLDPTYKTTVKCEGELLGEPITVKGNQVFITMTPEQKEYWYGKTFDVTYRLARSYTVEYNENTAHDSYLVRLENHQDQEITIVQEGNRFSNQRLMREVELNPIVNPRHSGFMYVSTEEQKSQAFRLNLSSNYIIANGLDSADFIVEVMDQDGNEVLSPYLDVFIMNDLGQITSQFGQFYPVVNKDTLKAKNAAGRSYFKYQAPLIRTTDTKKTQKVFAVAYDRKYKIGAQVPLIIRPSEPVYDITGKSLLETKLPEQTSPQAAIVFEYFARFYEKPVPVNHPILLLDKDKDGALTLTDLNQFLIEQTNASLMQEIAYALRETEAF